MNIRTALVALPLLILSLNSVQAQPALVTRSTAHLPPQEPDSSVLREVAVDVVFGVAREAPRVLLPLFDGNRSLELVQTSRIKRGRTLIWSGRVVGQEASTVLFAVGDQALVANVATQPTRERPAEHYEIRFLGRDHVLRQIDPTRVRPEGDPIPSGALAAPPVPTCSTDPGDEIDVLVLFTEKARQRAGGLEGMKNLIDVYVAESNLAYQQSQIGTLRLRLVGAEEVVYRESGNPASDLTKLKTPGGALRDVPGLRDSFGADLVVLIVHYTEEETDRTSCGNSFVMETVSNAFERSAFAVVPRRCADHANSFTHEIGHLLGARHDWTDDASAASPRKPFPFSHGFVHMPDDEESGPAFRTLMAKDDECRIDRKSCDRVVFFSNPDVKYLGTPTGVASGNEPSNNAETLRKTAPVVANFRCRKTNVTPP